MNKIKLIIIVVSIIFLKTIEHFAQEINEIPTGPIPKLKITKSIISENSKVNSATIAFGYSSQQEASLSMPIPLGNPFTILSPHTFTGFAASMCLGGDGKYYLIESNFWPQDPDPLLYEFNPINGAITLIGSISGLGTSIISGIAYNPSDGGYYICTHNEFYSLNINTRVATFIGSFGLTSGYMDDLCFDESGICYAIAIGSAQAFTINITTGVPTLLGSLGYYAIYGHGMSYDFETSTIYISAYNHTPQTGQLRTMDPLTGNTTLITDWGWEQIAPFAINTYYGPPCPVTTPFNPNPADGTTGVGISEKLLSWTNGSNAESVEVWYGISGNVVKVYDGPAISSIELDTLSYSTTYTWRVICKNDTCSSTGPYWYFLTESDSTVVFYDPFSDLNCWTPIGPQGFNNWYISYTNNSGGSPVSEVKLEGLFFNPFNGLSQLLSCPIIDDSYHYIVKVRHMLDVYSGSTWQYIGLAVSYDGGITKEIIWQSPISGDIGPEEIETEFYPSSSTFQMILYFNGYITQLNNWFVDDLILIDDCMECFPPATPTWLHATRYYNPLRVLLYWNDNSWNEEGFKIFRKRGFPGDSTQYELIGSVLANQHNFTDPNVFMDSTYTYRVLAYNQWGESDSSNTTTITMMPIPVELISFIVKVEKRKVILNWSTATELNNLGFEIERKTTGEFYTIGFTEGQGSTTEIHNYSFTDYYVERGINYYRLKQIDYNGNFNYSEEIELNFDIPEFFSLEQNYPNPFNPTTNIEFNLVVDSKVSLKIYDILGQEIIQLINTNLAAGNHKVDFTATSMNSGIYFYKLEAFGNNGESFSAVKKMILAK